MNELLKKYYATNQEKLRYQRQQLEFSLAIYWLEQVLQGRRGLRILEVGAGAGFYTRWLAEQGHQILAVEPSDVLIQELHQLQKDLGSSYVDIIHGDHRKIFAFRGDFDVVLLMGPLYHLFSQEERVELMRKSHDLIRNKNGIVWAQFLSRIGFLSYNLKWTAEKIQEGWGELTEIIKVGHISVAQELSTPAGAFLGNYDTIQSIQELYSSLSIQPFQWLSLDPLIGPDDSLFNQMSQDLRLYWFEVFKHISSWPDALGSSRTWVVLSR